VELHRLDAVLAGAVEICRERAEARHVSLTLAGDPNLSAEINARLVEQAVTNLIDNAVKYSEPGSTVKVVLESREDSVAVSVVDSGCGIPEEDLPRVFERFYRVDKARSRDMGGTGLGLAIVKHIAAAHGGTVQVSSEVGRGSTFTLGLPIRGKRG
jgi:signal transduction histidine kinase